MFNDQFNLKIELTDEEIISVGLPAYSITDGSQLPIVRDENGESVKPKIFTVSLGILPDDRDPEQNPYSGVHVISNAKFFDNYDDGQHEWGCHLGIYAAYSKEGLKKVISKKIDELYEKQHLFKYN